jgi:tRNA threonylcarbamoyladenosine biosynthesis protein TsaE
LELCKWWRPESYIYNSHEDDQKQIENTIHEILTSAVQLRMRSDVPVGSCLSGGLDSSILIGILFDRYQVDEGYPTFTASFPNHSLDETRLLGTSLADISHPGDVILLAGDLGAGKTTLTQFIAEGLQVPPEYYVTSPSFALLHEYPGRIPMYHIDCYRLEGEDDVEESGLMDYIVADGLAVVEWPDRLGSLVPDERLEIQLSMTDNDARVVTIESFGNSWHVRAGEVIKACGLTGVSS